MGTGHGLASAGISEMGTMGLALQAVRKLDPGIWGCSGKALLLLGSQSIAGVTQKVSAISRAHGKFTGHGARELVSSSIPVLACSLPV